MEVMIGMIAHQLRQPLTAISATAINIQFKMDLEAFDLNTKEGKNEQNLFFKENLRKIEDFTQNLSSTIDATLETFINQIKNQKKQALKKS